MTTTLKHNLSKSLKGKDLLTLLDLTKEDIIALLDSAIEIKQKHKNGEDTPYLKGKTLAMIFEKHSTRTRVSFEAGMLQLGGNAIYLNSNDMQLGRGESIADTAMVLSEYVDAIMIRTFEHKKIEELAEFASIPVINGLTEDFHPCQALADLLTIYERNKSFNGSKLVYVGDGNNVAHSLMIAAAKVGLDCTVVCPSQYAPKAFVVEKAKEIAKETNAVIEVSHDPVEGVQGADFIYTDVWASMGQEQEQLERKQVFMPYQVNSELVNVANEDYLFLHCLPAHRGEEVTAEVIDGPHSVVFEQAGNRLHAQKAVLKAIME
ncbi:ornithine carbamoyltransferase [Bacillus timonensis]|uniref:Ornithine carbamoyltransferase n=1 Tax=Bacillus timonensis TaxID=1033734 RepID=A0A4S3PP14_9BACI|nr:ornithine carbamoyltransferase [Bacillus timonensis]THE11198.1 ornithine carbamoyltransferase [Bacillus timonensis]